MDEELAKKIEIARALGALAYHEGKKSVPCHDKKLMESIDGMGINQKVVRVLEAWRYGWDTENLRAPW